MTKLCLECTKRYYFNVCIQNFWGACPRTPLTGHGFAMLEPPPPSTSGHGLEQRRDSSSSIIYVVVVVVLVVLLAYSCKNPAINTEV